VEEHRKVMELILSTLRLEQIKEQDQEVVIWE
jgi:hypothetical protein